MNLTETPANFVDFNDEDIQLQTIRYLNKQPRNASKSSLGWSTDHVQDLLYYCPAATKGFFNFLQLITNGQISNDTKLLLYRGRGIPLIQKDKVRPIVIQCPFHKTASHILVKQIKNKAIEICGNKQLGNAISGGIEVLIHSVRLILEQNPDFVIIKTDIKNAFNELSRHSIINAINEHIVEILPYVENLLSNSSEVLFNDKTNRTCAKIIQTIGVPQGSPSSGPIFNITQASTIKNIETEHPNIMILSVHDDHYIIGELPYALPALQMFDREFAILNLKRQETKSKIYHHNREFNEDEINDIQQYSLEIVPSTEGIVVAGAPIGSITFIEEYLMTEVNNIKEQLNKYIDITQRQFSSKKHDSQTLNAIMRKCISSQFTYLLRCCKPSNTKHAAEILDNELFKFFIHCIDAHNELEELDETEIKRIRQQVFLPLRHGGCGLTSSKFIAEAAFLGSISLSAHWIGKIIPSLVETEDNNVVNYPPTLEEFNNLLNNYKQLMPKELEKVSSLSIWENKIPKIQNIIIQKLYDNERINFENLIYNLDISAIGHTNIQNLSFHQMKARLFKIQHISNKNRHVSAWINANPADINYKMNNPAWNIAMKSRLQLNLFKSKLWCLCGDKMDHLCVHPYTCTNKNIYNAMRGPHHRKLKYVLHDLISTSGSKYKIENIREPLIEDYFPRIETPNSENSSSTINNDQNENIPDKSKNRADIILRNSTNGKLLLIDLKITDPFAKFINDHTMATQPANQAEAVKRKDYCKKYDIRPNNTAQMIFLTLTTSGAPSKDTIKFVNLLFHDEPAETLNFKKQQFYERLSSTIQTLKSLNIQNTLKSHTTTVTPSIAPRYSELLSSNHRNYYSNSPRSQNYQNSQISELTNLNDQENDTNFISTPIQQPSHSDRVTRSSSSSSSRNSRRNLNNVYFTVASTSGPATGSHLGRQSVVRH